MLLLLWGIWLLLLLLLLMLLLLWGIWSSSSSSSSNRVEIPPKTRYKQKQNETHYEKIIH
jgi:hypothetical protein